MVHFENVIQYSFSKWKYIPYNVNVAGQIYRNINIVSIDIES